MSNVWWHLSKDPTHSEFSRSPNPFCNYFPYSRCIIVIDTLSTWKNLPITSFIYSVEVTMVGKTKWKSLEVTLPWKIIN